MNATPTIAIAAPATWIRCEPLVQEDPREQCDEDRDEGDQRRDDADQSLRRRDREEHRAADVERRDRDERRPERAWRADRPAHREHDGQDGDRGRGPEDERRPVGVCVGGLVERDQREPEGGGGEQAEGRAGRDRLRREAESCSRLVSTIPTSAKAIPTACTLLGRSPRARPTTIGISGAVAEIGATTPIAPIASPW